MSKQPFRFWMTNCVAVATASLGGDFVASGTGPRASRSSRYRVTETIDRISALAARHGLSVFARLPDTGFAESESLVFESEPMDGTPVVMDGPASRPRLPLTVHVRRDEQGRTEVLFADSDWDGLPAKVSRAVNELPELVEEALQ